MPVVIGLKVIDITLYNDFINGADYSPLIKIIVNSEFDQDILKYLLTVEEWKEQQKRQQLIEERLIELYKFIFGTGSEQEYRKTIGRCTLHKELKDMILKYANVF